MAAVVRQWISEFGEQTSFLDAEDVGELAGELDAMRMVRSGHSTVRGTQAVKDRFWPVSRR